VAEEAEEAEEEVEVALGAGGGTTESRRGRPNAPDAA
jgi:hypothetical protein